MLHPASVSHLVTNGTIWARREVYQPVQSQDADCRMRILALFSVLVYTFPVVAKFWNYLIDRRLRGAWWLLATGFYAQFSSLALAAAHNISIANLVVRSPILFCRLRAALVP